MDGKGLTLSRSKLGVAQKGVVLKLIYFKSIESQWMYFWPQDTTGEKKKKGKGLISISWKGGVAADLRESTLKPLIEPWLLGSPSPSWRVPSGWLLGVWHSGCRHLPTTRKLGIVAAALGSYLWKSWISPRGRKRVQLMPSSGRTGKQSTQSNSTLTKCQLCARLVPGDVKMKKAWSLF